MELNLDDVRVFHNEIAHRFELQIAGLRALLTYRRFPDRFIIDHTEVPEPLEGKGLAAMLASSAVRASAAFVLGPGMCIRSSFTCVVRKASSLLGRFPTF